jgi:hypothetical protein
VHDSVGLFCLQELPHQLFRVQRVVAAAGHDLRLIRRHPEQLQVAKALSDLDGHRSVPRSRSYRAKFACGSALSRSPTGHQPGGSVPTGRSQSIGRPDGRVNTQVITRCTSRVDNLHSGDWRTF